MKKQKLGIISLRTEKGWTSYGIGTHMDAVHAYVRERALRYAWKAL